MSKQKEPIRPESGSSEDETQSSQLLFINKDANNLSRTAEETYAIGSHVSKGSRKWKNNNLELDASTSRILGGNEFDSDGDSTQIPTVSSTGEALTLRWRVLDGKVTSTKTVGAKDFAKAASASAPVSASTSADKTGIREDVPSDDIDPRSLASIMTPAPFSSSDEDHVRHVRSLLQIYFQQLRPSVFAISRSWIWIDDTALVLSSPALTYAICAFTSAFTIGAQQGQDKLCLPPGSQYAQESRQPLWPMPEWFLLQARAITLLRLHLSIPSDPSRPIQKAELHAILFLMRLHIMLGNQDAALMHMTAIQNATENAAILPDLRIDIAMWKINFILALKYPSAIRTRPYIPGATHTTQEPLLDIDLRHIADLAQRRRVFRTLMDRQILWTCTSPTPSTVPYAVESLIQDHLNVELEGYKNLDDSNAQQFRVCFLIARYLFAYLRYIDADTSLECIRDLVPDLQRRLATLTAEKDIRRQISQSMVYLLIAGAFASRGIEEEKIWFIRQLCRAMELNLFNTFEGMSNILGAFLDLGTVRHGLLLDVWDHVEREISGEVASSGGRRAV